MHVGFRKVLHGSVSDLQSDKCFPSLQEEKTAENTENCFYMKRIKCKDLEYICTKNHFPASSVCCVLYKLLVTFGCHSELNWLVIDMKHSCKFLHMCITRPSSGLIVEQQQLVEQTDKHPDIKIQRQTDKHCEGISTIFPTSGGRQTFCLTHSCSSSSHQMEPNSTNFHILHIVSGRTLFWSFLSGLIWILAALISMQTHELYRNLFQFYWMKQFVTENRAACLHTVKLVWIKDKQNMFSPIRRIMCYEIKDQYTIITTISFICWQTFHQQNVIFTTCNFRTLDELFTTQNALWLLAAVFFSSKHSLWLWPAEGANIYYTLSLCH